MLQRSFYIFLLNCYIWCGNVCGIVCCNACKRKEVVCCCVQLVPNTLNVQPGHSELFQLTVRSDLVIANYIIAAHLLLQVITGSTSTRKASETETRDMQAQLEENFGQSTNVRFCTCMLISNVLVSLVFFSSSCTFWSVALHLYELKEQQLRRKMQLFCRERRPAAAADHV